MTKRASLLLLAVMAISEGCATAYLQERAREHLLAEGFLPSTEASGYMIKADAPVGQRSVSLATAASRENRMLYAAAWLFDYVAVPSISGYGLYRAADDINDRDDEPAAKYQVQAERVTIVESRDGGVHVEQDHVVGD